MPPMTSGIICKLVRVPAGFELVFWLLFLKATGGGVVLMFKIYSRVYFEKQKLIFFFYRKVISLNYCLLQILKKNILFIHFESHKYLTGKRDYVKARYMTDVRENYTGKKISDLFILYVYKFLMHLDSSLRVPPQELPRICNVLQRVR